MMTLFSTLLGFASGGLPKLLDFFQSKQDNKHELELARLQNDRDMAMAERGFVAQQRVEGRDGQLGTSGGGVEVRRIDDGTRRAFDAE